MKQPKINPESMRKAFDHMHDTFVRKNTDYGNSFENSLDTFGIVAGIVRMSDKWERLLSLTNSKEGPLVASESVSDTLMDLANYATMLSVYLQDSMVENSDETIVYSGNKEIYRIGDGHIKFPGKKPESQPFTKTVDKDNQHKITFDGNSKIFTGTPVPPFDRVKKGDFWINSYMDQYVFDGQKWIDAHTIDYGLQVNQRIVADAIEKFIKILDFDMTPVVRVLDVDTNGTSEETNPHLQVNYRSNDFTVWGKTFRVNREVLGDKKSVYTVGFGDDENGWDYFSTKDDMLDNLLDSYCDMLDAYIDKTPAEHSFKMTCIRWLNRINYEKDKRNEAIEYIFGSTFERLGNPLIYVSLTDIAIYIAKYLSEHEEILGNAVNSLVLKDRQGLYLTNNNDSIMLLVLNELITGGKMGKNTVKKYDFIPKEERFVRLDDIESTVFRSDVAHYLTENTVYQGENLYFRDKNG